ncbi:MULTISPECIES: ABC transporter permease [unclassified Ensifer]|uniref:ABC transporter permease n=1 Tax=unclassified Ensifer TaxID=2633371 RepID=UPI0008885A65|nr:MULTISPECIES: ABC transporter permease [unclassified Ensifer]MBD9596361.1 ABC transporter permease [Ensifer sp. ENS05]SDN76543.1 putative spermidine/putrescine transport system permease protein [Ensifer sp. YR511]
MLLDFEKLGGLRTFLIGLTVLVCLFLVLPIVFIAALSFGSSQWLIFPPPSWTFRWYQELFADPRWLYSALTSLKIAAIVTVLSVVIGFLAALGLNRGTFVGREALRALFLTPMILPVVVLAVALYALFLKLGLAGTTLAFIIAHLLIALPFSIISIGNALESFDKSIEDAAVLCGANPWEARVRVTVPAVSHGIFAAAVFSFLASWDEVVLAIFMASPTLQTLPVKIWATLRQDLTPVIAAASTLLIAFTIVLMVLASLFRKGQKS